MGRLSLANRVWMQMLCVTFLFGTGCSSSQDEEDINAENNSNSGNNNGNKKNGDNINNSTDNEFVNNQGNMGKVGNVPPPIGGNSTNSLLTNNPSTNLPPVNSAPLNEAPPANQPPPSNVVTTPPPGPVTAPVTGFGPDGRGKVRYVRRSISKYSQANGTGAPAGSLEQGDHPLVVKEEGAWNQLSNGTFVESQELSDEGIGRTRKPRNWQ